VKRFAHISAMVGQKNHFLSRKSKCMTAKNPQTIISFVFKTTGQNLHLHT
jgi:hypothetical protein